MLLLNKYCDFGFNLSQDSNSSYDFVSYDNDPAPESSIFYKDAHGTKCAGVIAMSRDNGVCGVGVAHEAKVAGLRLITIHGVTDIQEARALSHSNDKIDIYSNSWGPSDRGFVVEGPRTLAKFALKNGAKTVNYDFMQTTICLWQL